MKFFNEELPDHTTGMDHIQHGGKVYHVQSYRLLFNFDSKHVHNGVIFLCPFKLICFDPVDRYQYWTIVQVSDFSRNLYDIFIKKEKFEHSFIGQTLLFECYWDSKGMLQTSDPIFNLSTKELYLRPSYWYEELKDEILSE